MREGDRIANKYVVDGELAEGGMGVVYRATHTTLGTSVAIKLVRPELRDSSDVRERFRHEAIATARCVHRNVIAILDYDDCREGPYFVMPLVRGRQLGATVARTGPWPLRRIKRAVLQLLSALTTTHARGVVHGDIKSDNVLVTNRGERDHLILIDYGLARLADQPRSGLEGMVSGTPEYLAPEVAAGTAPTMASDLYGVGTILYQLLAGRTPFAGGSPDVVLARQRDEPVPPLAERCPEREIPAALEQLIMASLAKDPRTRIQHATLFHAALNAIRIAPEDSAGPAPSVVVDTNAVTLELDHERDSTPTAIEGRARRSTRGG